MKHFGDITKLSGYTLPVVDVITGGSPCQDLSVAGKRAGLDGERSGLFMEQIRIVKEMRQHDRDNGRADELLRPRYMVWENVPGAFSSNGGADFQAVLTEIVRIAEPEAPNVPMPGKGKWSKSGCLYDDLGRWSVAWRVHDAQFWGVPQRRKRIALVADFGGLTAPEILFERESLRGNFAEGGSPWESFAAYAEGSSGIHDSSVNDSAITFEPGIAAREGGHIYERVSGTLRANMGDNQMAVAYADVVLETAGFCTEHSALYRGIGYEEEISPTLRAGVTPAVCVKTFDARGNGDGETVNTITGDHENRITDYTSVVVEPVYCLQGNGIDRADTAGCNGKGVKEDICYTLNTIDRPAVAYSLETFHCNNEEEKVPMLKARDWKDPNVVAYAESIAIDRAFFNQGQNAQYDPQYYTDGTSPTLVARGPSAVAVRYIVRRLTPLEYERLQGFPDGWTDIGEWVDSKGKKHKEADSPRYKALGNSIALPFWQWMARRICAQYERDITMASLFDGIGGFPLVFERCGAKAVWASEIEEFPIAVTKLRFPEE